ncbi:MAG: VCBS repeat-containing protein [Acidobacteria bacterium]|nr:VCBS repeat-containing protein [Acidobacteriota bacterium]
MDVEPVDFNGDGNLDLAIANSKSAGVDLGYGKGAFIPGPDLSTLPQGVPSAVAVGDFNSDGKLDAVLAISAPSSGIALLPGNGDGTFTPGADLDFIFFGESPSAIVAGDFNGDGVLDIAVTDSAQNDVAILLGLGSGSEGFDFAAVVPVGNQPQSIATGDFNDDGNLDLAIANSRDGTVTLLFGADDGTFQPAPRSPYTAGPAPLAIRAADFNDDGKLDLAVANFGGGVTVLIQQ